MYVSMFVYMYSMCGKLETFPIIAIIDAKARNAQEVYGGTSRDGFLESEIFLK